MRKIGLVVLNTIVLLCQSQSNYYEMFKDKAAVFVPDENRTYFMESFSVVKNDTGEVIKFNDLAGFLNGNWTKIIMDNNPGMRPIVKLHMKKVVAQPNGMGTFKTCAYNGNLCVILFPKKFIDEDE